MSQIKSPPEALKKPHDLTLHGSTRIDNYYWMRLTDEQKNARDLDSQTQEVVDYIAKENKYTLSSLSHTKKLQDTIFEEMVSRIKKDDESVPYLKNGYYSIHDLKKIKNIQFTAEKKNRLMQMRKFCLIKTIWQKGMNILRSVVYQLAPITHGWHTV